MNITDLEQTTNFDESLRPLFEAMTLGKRIKSVTCMNGTANKDNREKDLCLSDFVAKSYIPAFGWNKETGNTDLVTTEDNQQFYMHWVISFEL